MSIPTDPVGVYATATFTPAAAAYGAGDIMSVAKEFVWTYANGLPVPAGSLIRVLSSITKIDVTSVPSGQTSYTLRNYSRTPPSAQADNDAWTLASADLPYTRGAISLGTPVDEGAALYVESLDINKQIQLEASSSSSWGELVTDGAHTAAAVARTVTLMGMLV